MPRARTPLAPVEAAELEEKVAAHAGQKVVGLEGRLRGERVDELETGCRTEGHGERDRTIQLDDRGRHELGQSVVERGDALPVCFCRSARASVTRGDGGLERIRAEGTPEFFGALQRRETATDEDVIPARAVLIEEQDRLSRRTDSRAVPPTPPF